MLTRDREATTVRMSGLRGGSFNNNDNNLRAANRNNNNPTNENNNIGFRVAEAPEPRSKGHEQPARPAWVAFKLKQPCRAQGLLGHPACPLSRGQAKKQARPWRVAARRKARPGRSRSRHDTFVNVLLGSDTDPNHLLEADINGDGQPDGRDIDPFVRAMLTL